MARGEGMSFAGQGGDSGGDFGEGGVEVAARDRWCRVTGRSVAPVIGAVFGLATCALRGLISRFGLDDRFRYRFGGADHGVCRARRTPGPVRAAAWRG